MKKSRCQTPPTPTQHAFDALVREHIAPFLKNHGFRKTGLNWHLRRENPVSGWGAINIPKSVYGDRNHINFTVNLGVWFDARAKGLAQPT